MSYKPGPTPGVMEGDGAYNLHAGLRARGGKLALPYLEQAFRSITLNGGSEPG